MGERMRKSIQDSTSRARVHLGRGFSLVELIAVVLLLSIMAAAAVPAVSRAAEQRAAAGVELVARDILYARDSASSSGLGTWLAFDTAQQRYTVYRENRTNLGRAGRQVAADPATGLDFIVRFGVGDLSGLTLTAFSAGTGSEIGFDWQGRPKNQNEAALSSNAVVGLSNGRQIVIDAASGAVSIQ